MKSFKTLRGALSGEEDEDDPPYFAYRATFRIFSDTGLDFDAITARLGIHPTNTHRRGERKGPRSLPWKHDLWSYEPEMNEERPLSEHIDALWRVLKPHRDYLIALKSSASVSVFLGYRSNIDTAGVDVPHTSLEMFTALEIPFGLSIIIT
jgi:Domain of unknown function (DUF4279)